jgi:hypothetical protein
MFEKKTMTASVFSCLEEVETLAVAGTHLLTHWRSYDAAGQLVSSGFAGFGPYRGLPQPRLAQLYAELTARA